MMRYSLLIICFCLMTCVALGQVKMKPGSLYDVKLGNPKVADGSMDEWSAVEYPGGHGTVDNEWYFYDSGYSHWKMPQGGTYDEPLSLGVVKSHPIYGIPMPVASGLNLWGAYLCYEPFLDGHSVTVALDLPCSSNMAVSPEYFHPYSGLPPLYEFFYPVAFDADGNGDPNTVSELYINGLIFESRDEEAYNVTFYLGDDDFPKAHRLPSGTGGLIIKVALRSEFGVIYPPTAVIPGTQTKNGEDLDLVAAYGPDVLYVGGHDDPDPTPGATPRIVDIEVKLNQLKTIIEDPTYIDWSKVGIGKIGVYDLNKIFLSVKSGSLDDKSDEHFIQGGHVFPAYPITNVK